MINELTELIKFFTTHTPEMAYKSPLRTRKTRNEKFVSDN